jgi:murein DD-endopeptidase MepM/ murein hydrolase activator NlpD
MSRLALVAAVLTVPVVLGAPRAADRAAPDPAQAARAGPVVVAYRAPVPGAVVRPFVPPPTPYAAGHRGVDLAAGPGAPVGAAAAGTVRFAGSVARRGVVVLAHPDGITTEYEPVRPLVAAGQAVGAGQVVGRIAGRHAGCPGSCLHWGARRGTTYLDPLALLRRLGPVVLLPWPRRPG